MITRGFNSKYACIRHKTRGIGRCPLCTMPSQRGPIAVPEKPVEVSVNTRFGETPADMSRSGPVPNMRRKFEKSHALLVQVFNEQSVCDAMPHWLFKLIQQQLKDP